MDGDGLIIITTAGENVNSAVITFLATRAAPEDDRVRLTLRQISNNEQTSRGKAAAGRG